MIERDELEKLSPGSVFELPVLQSPTRQLWTADNTLVTSAANPNPWVEITALATSTLFDKQLYTVRENSGGGTVQVDKPNYRGAEHATDLGTMRMRPENALDLAIAILAYLGEAGLMEKSAVTAKLREKLEL